MPAVCGQPAGRGREHQSTFPGSLLFTRDLGNRGKRALLKVEILTKPFQTVPATFSLNLLFCNKILTHFVLGCG